MTWEPELEGVEIIQVWREKEVIQAAAAPPSPPQGIS